MIRRIFAAPIFFALSLASCYAPSIEDGQFTCAGSGECPSGFACRCGVCRPGADTECLDASANGDAADLASRTDGPPPPPPCTNGGQRAAGDPGNPHVALCPAAWAVPGIATAPAMATPCSQHPTADGTDGHGKSCSAADNCGAGWHVCTDDLELRNYGLVGSDCTKLSTQNPAELFLTRQPGDVVMPDGGGQPPPPLCAGVVNHVVFGCGNLGMMAPSCTVLNRVLTSMPGSGDGCSASTNGVFSCAGVDPPGGKFEATLVVKSTVGGGGVMCCEDTSHPQ